MSNDHSFARTPEPPYYVVVFSSQRSEVDDDAYQQTAQRMLELAETQEGYLGVERTRGADGFGITASYWTSRSAISSWKANVEHLAAQKGGNTSWYDHYEIRIARVERAYAKKALAASLAGDASGNRIITDHN
jgi:heme-degrading monooxygenase HmoA